MKSKNNIWTSDQVDRAIPTLIRAEVQARKWVLTSGFYKKDGITFYECEGQRFIGWSSWLEKYITIERGICSEPSRTCT